MKEYALLNLKQGSIMSDIFKGLTYFEQLSQESNLKKCWFTMEATNKKKSSVDTVMLWKEFCK